MRRLIAAVFVMTLLITGCTPSGENQPEPGPTTASAPPDGVPAATDAQESLVAALNKQDVSKVSMVGDPAEAQAEFKTVFAGMDEIYPAVTAGAITYEGSDKATAALSLEFPLGESGWAYETVASFRLIADVWRLEWAPTLLNPELTSDTRLRHTQVEAKRSAINDNAGLALMEERTLYEIGLDKSKLTEAQWSGAAGELATALKIDVAKFREKVLASGEKAFVIALTMRQEDIPPAVSSISGAHVSETTAVVGPSASFASSILGTVGAPTQEMIDKSEGKLSSLDRVGITGLQNRYDEQLRGAPEIKVDLVARTNTADSSASPVSIEPRTLFHQEPSIGSAIDLSLDRDLQTKAEEVLSTQKGIAALVVVSIADSGVLAAAQSPAAGSFPHATFGKYAPGSTFKVASALAMLRSGKTPSSTVQCPANLKVGGYTFGNYSGYPASGLGTITLTDAFKNSCNTTFVGAGITGEQLNAAAASLGVGTNYDAGFTSYFGTVKPGDNIDRAASAIGQGTVTMSPLGMAAVAASVGSGKTVIPWLVKGEQASSTAAPLSTTESQQLQTMMKATVDSGTGSSLKGLMTGAKSGTAEWGETGKQQTHAWMIAYNDTVAVASFVEVGDSGGSTAAPLITKLLG